jgi:hypothetical protein
MAPPRVYSWSSLPIAPRRQRLRGRPLQWSKVRRAEASGGGGENHGLSQRQAGMGASISGAGLVGSPSSPGFAAPSDAEDGPQSGAARAARRCTVARHGAFGARAAPARRISLCLRATQEQDQRRFSPGLGGKDRPVTLIDASTAPRITRTRLLEGNRATTRPSIETESVTGPAVGPRAPQGQPNRGRKTQPAKRQPSSPTLRRGSC